jgi:CelD/BcsL family acetyltransferase involved in cellulose biosynthesis
MITICRILNKNYIVDTLTSQSELLSIAPEWLQLWRETDHATPFQSPYWNLAWWHYLNPGGTLAVVTVRHCGELIALAPWWLSDGRETGRRVLTFMGSGISDCLDVLCKPGLAIAWFPEVVQDVIRRLNCDECDLDELGSDSPVLDAADGRLAGYAERGNVCPVLQLSSIGDSSDGPVPRHAARTLGYYRRRLARMHRTEIEAANQQNINYLLSELFRLHQAEWSARGQPGVLCGGEIAAFHRDAAAGLLREDMLRLYLLKIDGRSAAVFYGFRGNHSTYYYIGGFAPAFGRLNPGTVLIGHAIEQAIHEGSREFNFLRGNEQYKYWWGARDRPNYRLHIPENPVLIP